MMDRKKLVVGLVAVVVLALGGGAAIAAQQQQDPKIDRAAAEEAALGAVPGEVKQTELESEGGSTIYEVEVVGKDGKLREVTVDASNGRVLGQEMEEEEFFDEGNDSDDQGSDDAE
jgi:lipopolysaccharide export LptBFGC system permease protein LptF